jgi:hypothetical protein
MGLPSGPIRVAVSREKKSIQLFLDPLDYFPLVAGNCACSFFVLEKEGEKARWGCGAWQLF